MSTNPSFSFSLSEEQILREGARLRQLARRLVADEHEREDVVQEGFLRSLGRRFVDRGHQERWLRTTLRHFAAEGSRAAANQRARERTVAREEATSSPEDVALRLEAIELVARALRSLREPYRSTLTQLYVDDLSPKQVARLTGVSVDAVHQRKHRGLELMRAELDHRAGGRESWVALCVSLARSSRGGALVVGASWLAPLAAAAGIAALVLGLTWLYGAERAPSLAAALAEGAVPDSGAVERVAIGQSGNARSAIPIEEPIEVQVVRSGTLDPVPAATIQCWRMPEGFDAETTIQAWLERGLLEERTRESSFERVADDAGLVFVPRAPHGLLVVAKRDKLWGFALSHASASGPVRVEVFPDSDVTVVVEGDGDPEGLLVSMGALGYWGNDLVSDTTDARGEAVLRHAGFAKESRRGQGPIVLRLSVRSLGGRLAWRQDFSPEESRVVLQLDERGQQIAFADIRIVDDLTGELIPGEEHIWVGDGSIRVSNGVATLPIPVGLSVDWEDIGFEVRNAPGSPLQASTAGEHIAITLTPTRYPQPATCGKVIGRLLRLDGSPLAERSVSVSSADAWMAGKGKARASGVFEVEVHGSMAVRQSCDLWLTDENGPFLQLSRGLMIAPERVTDLGEIRVPEHPNMISGRVISRAGPLINAEIQLRDGRGDNGQGLTAHTRSDGSFEFPDGLFMGSAGEEYLLVVSHPEFGPHHQKITIPSEGLTLMLTPARAVTGRIVLDASIPHDKVWVEASGLESDLGWSPYNNIEYVPTPCFARAPIRSSGHFELSGLGSGYYTLRVVYYGVEAFETTKASLLGGTDFELSDNETGVRELDPIELTRQVHCVRVTVEDSSGTTVSDAVLEVHGDDDDDPCGITVDSTGSAVLLVSRNARIRAQSKACFPGEMNVWYEPVRFVLEPRPRIDFAIDGGRPSMKDGFDVFLRVEDVDGTFADVEFDEHGRAHCLAPDRAICRMKYILQHTGCGAECGVTVIPLDGMPLEGLKPLTLVLPSPDPDVLTAAADVLCAQHDE